MDVLHVVTVVHAISPAELAYDGQAQHPLVASGSMGASLVVSADMLAAVACALQTWLAPSVLPTCQHLEAEAACWL